MAEQLKSYKLREGMQHFHDGAEVKPGGVVKLTPAQVKAFGDKFQEVNEPLEVPPGPAIPQANPGVPQDIGAKTGNTGGLNQTGANEVKVKGDSPVVTPAGQQLLDQDKKQDEKNAAGKDKA